MGIKCLKCQYDNPDTQKFCGECGTQLIPSDEISVSQTKTFQPDKSEEKLERIGNYKLVEVIGKGGMGTVYLAQQEKPIRRKVAIKVIKPGMDSKEIVARFESEQQALALLNHPNIAQVYDSGETEQGYPYFVMEYVPGNPITEYCDKNKMTTEERLRLFEQVCDAIQHAHFKGIIHRDLKPSNILVTFQDNKHIPKIIDFGIAKALTGQGLTEKTLHTIHGVAIGTPVYMSPEQAELTGFDIDTRTDVYSLGVLLYELLVGLTPFEEKELEKAGLMEILRIIREIEPPRPSTRFGSLGDTSTEIAYRRGTNIISMAKQLKRDLDWIVMKALEKDKQRRYSSAAEFARDIDRYLNREPIIARPPSVVYKISKYIRRHKAASIAALSILLLIIIFSFWNVLERQKAIKSAREANYNFAIALKEKAKASAKINQWQLVKLLSANSLLYQKRAQKQIPMGDIELPFGKMDWGLRNCIYFDYQRFFLISPDCKFAAYEADLGHTLKIVEIPDGKEVLALKGIESAISSICFSPDGRLLAVVSGDKPIKIWDLYTRDEVSVLGDGGDVREISFSNNGKYLASYESRKRAIKIWEISNGKIVKNVKVKGIGMTLDFSPDGKYLTVNDEAFNEIEIIDVSKGKAIGTIKGRKLGKIFSPSGKYLAIGSLADEIKILEPSGRKQVFSLSDHDVTVLCFSPDERYLASGSRDNSIKVYDLENGNKFLTLKGHNGAITSVDFSHDNNYLVSGSQDKTIKLWNLWNGNEVSTLLGHDKQDIFVRFSPDDRYILSNCSNKFNIWELSRSEMAASLLGHNDKISSVQFSPNGQYFASASYDKTIKIWEISSGRVMSIIKGHDEGVTSICFSPDGNYLASGSNDKTIKIWDILTGKEIAIFNKFEAEILSVNFGLNGDSLFSWARNGYGFYLELEKSELVPKLIALPVIGVEPTLKEISWRGIISFDYYPDKKLFTYAYGNDIEVVKFSNPLDDPYLFWMVQRLGISKEKIEVGKKLSRFELPSYKTRGDSPISIIAENITTLSGHSGPITSISISPDGKYLASGSQDKTIKVWDLSTSREVFTLRGHSDIVTSIDFSPDGKYLASGSEDKSIMVWQIDSIMNYLWLGLEHAYKEKDILKILWEIEKQTGLSLKGMLPIDTSSSYFGIR